MRWTPVNVPDLVQDLILFDGDCVLCSHWARLVHERDRGGRFKFVALQSPYGRSLAARFGIHADDPQTNLVVAKGRVSFKSDAALGILSLLPGWAWTGAARVIPRPLRDWLYDRMARNRFRLFGRRGRCWAGDRAFAERILEHAP
jgi:predicted DCC family thiol-disulfide oxidoreductase YuxK